MSQLVIPAESIVRQIYWVRGHRVMLDEDLAELYQVSTGSLNQAVKRNIERFPEDFMFELTGDEFENLKSQIVISRSWGGRRKLPKAFTQEGVAMLSGILRSERAIRVNVEIMRAFVRMRQMAALNREIFEELKMIDEHLEQHDEQLKIVFQVIQQLIAPPEENKNRIGFKINDDA